MQRNVTMKLLRGVAQTRPPPINSSHIRPLSTQLGASRTAASWASFNPKSSTQSLQFSTTSKTNKGISPDSDNPKPREPLETAPSAAAPVDLSTEEYNQISDEYMDAIVEKLEALQEEREDVDVEYSAGVLTLTFPPIGTYVINKQPPNKQIWLSSPISGPKRYDYVILGEGQNEKEGTGGGEWVYLRDMSTLGGLLSKEVGVDLGEGFMARGADVGE